MNASTLDISSAIGERRDGGGGHENTMGEGASQTPKEHATSVTIVLVGGTTGAGLVSQQQQGERGEWERGRHRQHFYQETSKGKRADNTTGQRGNPSSLRDARSEKGQTSSTDDRQRRSTPVTKGGRHNSATQTDRPTDRQTDKTRAHTRTGMCTQLVCSGHSSSSCVENPKHPAPAPALPERA